MIALTGLGRESDIERASGAGFSAQVTKPFALQALIDLIANISTGNHVKPSEPETKCLKPSELAI